MAQRVSLADAVGELVHDGDVVALEGFTHLIPHAAGHELIRQGRRELTLVRMTPDIVYDQMIGMGCAARCFLLGREPRRRFAPRLRDAVQSGWPGPLSSTSTRTRAWPPAMRRVRRTSRSVCFAATPARSWPRRRPRSRASPALHRRGARRREGTSSRCRRHPRPAGRRAGERADVGHHGRAEGSGARVRHAIVTVEEIVPCSSCAPAASSSPRGRSMRCASLQAAHIPPTRTTTTTATTPSTSSGTRSAGTATRSGSGWGSHVLETSDINEYHASLQVAA